jgi:large subunit ribosomal protein L29
MKAEEIRKLSDMELTKQLEEAHQELFNLRFRSATNQLTDYTEVRKVRRNIARMKTIIRERELTEKR